MIKSIVTVIFSWLVSLGIYHEIPIAYGVYWTVSTIALVLLLGVMLLVPCATFTEDVRAQLKEGLFSVKMAMQSLLVTPAFLYAAVASGSWNTLGLYVAVLTCLVSFLFWVLKNPRLGT